MSDIIHWEQAYHNFKHNNEKDIAEAKRLIKEIETSNFSILDARDVHYYVNQLNELSDRQKPYTPNEIREINMVAKGLSRYEMLESFMNDDTDDVIDFY